MPAPTMQLNAPYAFAYDVRVGGQSVAEVEGRCTLIVNTRADHAFVLDVEDIEFLFTDWADATKTQTVSGYVAAQTAPELALESAVRAWLTGAGERQALDRLDMGALKADARAAAAEARHAFHADAAE